MSTERIRLDVQGGTRKRLKAVARRLGRTGTAVARELFLDALTRAARAPFHDRVASEMTPKIRKRMIEIAEALERING